MCTPHPSLVPIEMASAGMVTVTNSFETKTPEAMSAISSNLLTVAPSLGAVIAGLTKAVEMSGDFDRRIEGSKVNWSRSWTESLNAELMNEVSALLSKC